LVSAEFGSLEVYRKGAEPSEDGGRDRNCENLIPGHETNRSIESNADPEGVKACDVVRRDNERSALGDVFHPVVFDAKKNAHGQEQRAGGQMNGDTILTLIQQIDIDEGPRSET